MKKIIVFAALFASGLGLNAFAGNKGDSGNPGDKPERMVTTDDNLTEGSMLVFAYRSQRNANVPVGNDEDYLFGLALNESIWSTTPACRTNFLAQQVDPECTSGCKTYSYYFFANGGGNADPSSEYFTICPF